MGVVIKATEGVGPLDKLLFISCLLLTVGLASSSLTTTVMAVKKTVKPVDYWFNHEDGDD